MDGRGSRGTDTSGANSLRARDHPRGGAALTIVLHAPGGERPGAAIATNAVNVVIGSNGSVSCPPYADDHELRVGTE